MNIVLRLAWRNLWRQPRRTWLTIGAMVFSNALLVFMISLQFGMYELMIDNTLQAFTGHIQVQAPGYKDDMKMRQVVPDVDRLAEDLRTQLDLQTVAARAATFSLLSSEERSYGVQIVGVDPAHESSVSTIPGLVKKGRFPTDNNAAEIVIGTVLARNLRVDVGAELTLLGSGRDGSFAAAIADVVGIFDSGVADIDRSIAEIPLGFFQDTFFMQGAGHMVVIATPGLTLIDDYVLKTEALLPEGADLAVHDWMALQPGLKQAIQADLGSAFFMYGVLVILVAFSVLNTQLMSVLERTREFGVITALGIKPRKLASLVLLETTLMALIGLVIGVFLGWLVAAYFNSVGFSYPGMEEVAARFNLPGKMYPSVTLFTMMLGPLVVFLFCMLAAIYPSLRLFRLQPVEAMRAV